MDEGSDAAAVVIMALKSRSLPALTTSHCISDGIVQGLWGEEDPCPQNTGKMSHGTFQRYVPVIVHLKLTLTNPQISYKLHDSSKTDFHFHEP